jgi:hypothetical protein
MTVPTMSDPPTEILGQPGEHCTHCGSPLATDQRYCLSCGHRRGGPRVDFRSELGLVDESPAPPPATAPRPAGQREQLPVAAALLAALIALGIGVLIGHGSRDEPAPVAQRPPIVNISGAGAPPASTTAPAATGAVVSDDWTATKTAWTVQLQAFPKATTQAATILAAKSDAEGKGATGVGTLDGDAHGAPAPGSYVLFSGQHTSQKAADSALSKLKGDFPDAAVMKVAGTDGAPQDDAADTSSDAGAKDATTKALKNESKVSGKAYSEQSKKLPSKIGTSGPAPTKDDKQPGGGTSATEIG